MTAIDFSQLTEDDLATAWPVAAFNLFTAGATFRHLYLPLWEKAERVIAGSPAHLAANTLAANGAALLAVEAEITRRGHGLPVASGGMALLGIDALLDLARTLDPTDLDGLLSGLVGFCLGPEIRKECASRN